MHRSIAELENIKWRLESELKQVNQQLALAKTHRDGRDTATRTESLFDGNNLVSIVDDDDDDVDDVDDEEEEEEEQDGDKQKQKHRLKRAFELLEAEERREAAEKRAKDIKAAQARAAATPGYYEPRLQRSTAAGAPLSRKKKNAGMRHNFRQKTTKKKNGASNFYNKRKRVALAPSASSYGWAESEWRDSYGGGGRGGVDRDTDRK